MTRCRRLLIDIITACLIQLARLVVRLNFLLARCLPDRWLARLGHPVAVFMRHSHKDKILGRMEEVLGPFPSPNERERVWRLHLEHIGRCVFEPFQMYWSKDEDLIANIRISGEELLQQALAEGKGAVLFLDHIGNPGSLVAAFGIRDYDIAIAGNPVIAVEDMVARLFKRGRVERVLLGERMPARMAEILKRNGLFGIFIDFPVVLKHNVILPFGRTGASVNLGPGLLALRQGAPVFSVTSIRTGPNQHRVVIAPLARPAKGPLREAAAELVEDAFDSMFQTLRSHPDQWWPWDEVCLEKPPASCPSNDQPSLA
ncbi:MAG: lysophospholipid acyltransferase family protein [Luteolibacter sp.]